MKMAHWNFSYWHPFDQCALLQNHFGIQKSDGNGWIYLHTAYIWIILSQKCGGLGLNGNRLAQIKLKKKKKKKK